MLTKEKRKEALYVGRTKDMLDSGYSKEEIAETLGCSIATINAYEKVINEAELNKKNMEES